MDSNPEQHDISAPEAQDSAVGEDFARWNYGWHRKADRTGPDVLFDPSSVQDTLQGRICGFLQRLKRKTQFHSHVFLRACRDPLWDYDDMLRGKTVSYYDNGKVAIGCSGCRWPHVVDRRGPIRKLIGLLLNLRKYGSYHHPAWRYWD